MRVERIDTVTFFFESYETVKLHCRRAERTKREREKRTVILTFPDRSINNVNALLSLIDYIKIFGIGFKLNSPIR